MEKKFIDAVLRPLSKKTTQIYGYKETINSISQSKIIFYSSSLSNERVKHLQDLCDNSNVPCVKYEGSSSDLGHVCRKLFRVLTVSIQQSEKDDLNNLFKTLGIENE